MVAKRVIGGQSRDKRKKRKPNPIILIVTEGKDTEINYFKNFNNKYLKVDVRLPEGKSAGKNKGRKTDPFNLVKKAIEFAESKYDINAEDGDRIWCLMDVDLNHNNSDALDKRIEEFEKACRLANTYEKKTKNRIHFGISNPCFEIWYLLHYYYTTGNFKDFSMVQSRLEKDTPIKNYEKTIDIFSIIHEKTWDAINNCEKLKSYHQQQGKRVLVEENEYFKVNIRDIVNSNPYTNVNELLKYIETLNKNK